MTLASLISSTVEKEEFQPRTVREQRLKWLVQGRKKNAALMVIVCVPRKENPKEGTDFPLYVDSKNASFAETQNLLRELVAVGYIIHEVYDLRDLMRPQILAARCWRIPPPLNAKGVPVVHIHDWLDNQVCSLCGETDDIRGAYLCTFCKIDDHEKCVSCDCDICKNVPPIGYYCINSRHVMCLLLDCACACHTVARKDAKLPLDNTTTKV